MLFELTRRLFRSTDKRVLWKFANQFVIKGGRSVRRFKKRAANGEFFPPFLYISLTNRCNLHCAGCWVDVADDPRQLDPDALNRLISQAKAQGNSFFGLLGGEPLLYGPLLDVLDTHSDCYFQVFIKHSKSIIGITADKTSRVIIYHLSPYPFRILVGGDRK